MKLLLSGGGDSNQVKELDELFCAEVGKEARILYVPIAWDKGPYEGCLNWFKSVYEPFGFTNIEMTTDLVNVDLSKYDAIYIGGGNTFKLLKEIKATGFDVKLMSFLNENKFVYGGSAGAIIFGKTINPALFGDENEVGLTDLNGLNVLGNKDVWCHFNEDQKNLVNEYNNDLYILYEESGLYINNEHVINVGKEIITTELKR